MDERFPQLRQRAEQIVKKAEVDMSSLSESDIQNLIHQLDVHRVELELQNEELLRSNTEAEEARRKYRDLFEFAPVGYVTLDQHYHILDANHSVARLLGMKKPQLLKRPLTDVVCPESQDAFYLAAQEGIRSQELSTVDLQLFHTQRDRLWAHLEIQAEDGGQSYRVSLNDVTRQKEVELEILTLNRRIEASIIAGDMAWWEMELPSGLVVFNENKAAMLGFPPERFARYQDFTDLLHPEDYEPTMEACRRHVRGEAALYDCEYRIRTHDGSYAWFHDVGRIIERDEERIKLVGIATDITARKQAELHLQEALAEKEVLLKEIHHRVKNNMQMIASLLYKQQQFSDDACSRAVLDDSIQRVKSMAMIHEHIYRAKNLASINLAEYLNRLATTLFRTYKPKGRAITLTVNVDEIYLSVDTSIPVALIVNELLTNALKYAFPAERAGEIRITGHRESAEMILSVSDNGIGLPEDFDIQQVSSLGLYLVQKLATKQLGGTLDIHGRDSTEVTMTFSVEKSV